MKKEGLTACCCGGKVGFDGGKYWWAIRCEKCGYTTPRQLSIVAAKESHNNHVKKAKKLVKKIRRLEEWLTYGSDIDAGLFGRGLTAQECNEILEGKKHVKI
jgi:hypothetical protein